MNRGIVLSRLKKFLVLLLIFFSLDLVNAQSTSGTLTLDLTPDVSIQENLTFQPIYLKIVKLENNIEKIIWKSFVNKSEDLSISVPYGSYKVYVQLQGHKTLWELNNNGSYYTVSSDSAIVIPSGQTRPRAMFLQMLLGE